ncbi:MAG: 50S ribosomal protein L1 [Candidatus Margulisbacteria bacterium]|jgi:large subunit ribosomal protein L1|nr:50S ribosomal protein L1 [Candidatus Margulisiibacteriota bacterium]
MNNKKYLEVAKKVDREKLYKPAEALQLLPQTKRAKFDESVDLGIKLDVDTVKNPSIRGTVVLPAGSGKQRKVAVITNPSRVKEAEDAGASIAGAADLIEKIKGGFFDFDIVIASPDMMAEVGKLGKILGTKGLMPNPKAGTVTPEIGKAVAEFRGGKVEFKMDKGGAVHLGIGKVSFSAEQLHQNLKAAVGAISHAKPSGHKGGAFVKSVTISTTMGPGIKIDPRLMVEEASA